MKFIVPYRFNSEKKVSCQRAVRRNSSISAFARLLLLEIMDLVNYAHKKYGWDVIKYDRKFFSENLSKSKPQISKLFNELESKFFIRRYRKSHAWFIGILPINFTKLVPLGLTRQFAGAGPVRLNGTQGTGTDADKRGWIPSIEADMEKRKPRLNNKIPITRQSQNEVHALATKLGIEQNYVDKYIAKTNLLEALHHIDKNYPSKISQPTAFFTSWIRGTVSIPLKTEHTIRTEEKARKQEELKQKEEWEIRKQEKEKKYRERDVLRQHERIQKLVKINMDQSDRLLKHISKELKKGIVLHDLYEETKKEQSKKGKKLWETSFYSFAYEYIASVEDTKDIKLMAGLNKEMGEALDKVHQEAKEWQRTQDQKLEKSNKNELLGHKR